MPHIKIFFWSLLALLLFPAVSTATTLDRNWEIHLLHHTHVDIGYTHPQEDVMQLQWQNLEKALDLIDATAEFPNEARFRWNPEVTWVIETWLQQADVGNRDRFINAVRHGFIGVDGLYGNLLAELCRPRELLAALDYKNELEKLTGVQIDSAMISDVPGAPWGLVSALSQNGVKYLSWGPNSSHRIGFALQDWADRPFFWTSPSGKDRVLVFIHGKGYYWFNNGRNFTPDVIFPYLNKLAAGGYPYAILPIRYSRADNGPPDPEISKIVKEWNERYPEVQVKLTTVSQSFRQLEERYGDKIPTFTGDFTPYWVDGAASSARETALARQVSEKLGAYETILAQAEPQASFPEGLFRDAWNQVLLFNEHTWGAYDSITAPDGEFAKELWDWKRERAIKAASIAEEIFAGTFAYPTSGAAVPIRVINPNSWNITGPVTLAEYGLPGGKVETPDGRPAPSQILSDGRLLFMAEEVSGLSSKEYFVKPGAYGSNGSCTVKHNSIENDRLVLRWDSRTGKITGLTSKIDGRQYVNTKFRDSFNEYIYVAGRNPGTSRKKSGAKARIAVKEAGPLVCTVEMTRKVPGSNSLVTSITMYAGMERIDLVNTLDRPVVRTPEGIHFAFPVAATNPVVRYDTAWGSVEVDKDQLKGSCKNYFTPLRWVDVSGEDGGLTIVLVDAPLFEAGAIATDAIRYGWKRQTKHNGVVYSYVMNNYWETNYKADQPGATSFRYSIFPHGAYDTASNMKHSLEVMRPLFATGTSESFSVAAPSIMTGNDNVIIESIRPYADGGLEIDLYNLSDHEEKTRIESPGCGELLKIESGRQLTQISDGSLVMGRHELLRLVCRE